MKYLLLLFTALVCIQVYSQQGSNNVLSWKLQNEYDFINTNSTIGIYITNLTIDSAEYPNLVVVPDKFERIKCVTIGYDEGQGFLIKVIIPSGSEFIGNDIKFFVKNSSTNKILGILKINIGSNAPSILFSQSSGDLIIGSTISNRVDIVGTNLDGVRAILSKDNLAHIDSFKVISSSRITAYMTANGSTPIKYTRYELVYLSFNPTTLRLVSDTTNEFQANIQLKNSTAIELQPEKSDFFVEDVKLDKGWIKVPFTKKASQLSAVDFKNLEVLQDKESWIEPIDDTKAILHLFITNPDYLEPGKLRVQLKSQGPNPKDYVLVLNFLNEPEVSKVYNEQGNLICLIKPNTEHVITIEGKRLSNTQLLTLHTELFEVPVSKSNGDDICEWSIKIKSSVKEFAARKYYFLLKTNNRTIETIVIDFEKPVIPQNIKSLVRISQGKDTLEVGSEITVDITKKESNLVLSVLPKRVNKSLGLQSINITVDYYNMDGSLITSEKLVRNGSYEIELREDMDSIPVIIDLKRNSKDFVREWGKAIITINHTSDFYKHQLHLKSPFIQEIYFIGRKTVPTLALTIPPALFIYGRDNANRFEALPINVGAGLRLDFYKQSNGKNSIYVKRSFSLGFYLAGINFAERTVSNGGGGFIKQGDLAVMSLVEFYLRRYDNFVKVPIFIGPGVTLPIAGVTSRGFLAIGIGLNL